MKRYPLLTLALTLAACARMDQVGRVPDLTPAEQSPEFTAMAASGLPETAGVTRASSDASLWSGARGSLLGDRRARQAGDILTVVIEINDKAEITNATGRTRSASDKMGVPDLLGIPQRIEAGLPNGASTDSAFSANARSSYQGQGNVSRGEKLTLRVAATVLEVLPNGALRIEGRQEVRVNFEVRELIVAGFVRAEDVSRQNEITYDKIAGARISYGGRGQISDVQQPRLGQQVADIVLPY